MTGLGVWFVSTTRVGTDGYPLSSAVKALESTALTYGLAAAAGALAASRLRASGAFDLPLVRGRLRVVADVVGPIAGSALVAVAITIWWSQLRDGALGWPGWSVVVAQGFLLVAVVCVGVAVGRRVVGWLAASLAVVLVYVSLGFPAAIEPLWVRHLVGLSSGGCCRIDQGVDFRVVIASIAVSAGVSACAVGIATLPARATGRAPERVRVAVVALVCLVVGVVAGAGAVLGMGPDPVSDRPGGPECAEARPGGQACVWPEHRPALAHYLPLLDAVARTEAAAGLEPTTVFTESRSEDATAARLYLRLTSDLRTRTEDVVRALVPDTGECLTPDGLPVRQASTTDVDDVLLLRDWWSRHLSAAGSGGAEPGSASPLDALAPDDRRRWVSATTAALRSCTATTPVPDP
jgi:hypothetical protein